MKTGKITKLTLKQWLALNAFSVHKQAQTKLHELIYLFWECTLRCNLACRHCGSDCTAGPSAKDMPLEDFLRVLDLITGNNGGKRIVDNHRTLIALTGGEPLMRPDLEKCGKAFREREFPWGMVSNGWHLDETTFDRLLKAGLSSLTISLDGLEQNHEWLRGRSGSFKRALRSIKLASTVKGLAFDVVTCLNRRNISELPAIRDILINSGVKQWRIFTIFPKGRAVNEPAFEITPAEFKGLMDFIVETNNGGVIFPNYGCEGFLGPYEGYARKNLFSAGREFQSVPF